MICEPCGNRWKHWENGEITTIRKTERKGFESLIAHHTVRTRTRFFMKKGSGIFLQHWDSIVLEDSVLVKRVENLWTRDGSCSHTFTLFALFFLKSLSFLRYNKGVQRYFFFVSFLRKEEII